MLACLQDFPLLSIILIVAFEVLNHQRQCFQSNRWHKIFLPLLFSNECWVFHKQFQDYLTNLRVVLFFVDFGNWWGHEFQDIIFLSKWTEQHGQSLKSNQLLFQHLTFTNAILNAYRDVQALNANLKNLIRRYHSWQPVVPIFILHLALFLPLNQLTFVFSFVLAVSSVFWTW